MLFVNRAIKVATRDSLGTLKEVNITFGLLVITSGNTKH